MPKLLEKVIPFCLKYYQSKQSFLPIGVPKSQLIIMVMLLPTKYIETKKVATDSNKESRIKT